MNFYDKIHELTRCLKKTNEYKEYISLKNSLKEDEKPYNLIKEFKNKQNELQLNYLNGKEMSKDEEQEMQNMYSLIIQNEKSRKLFENEMKINVTLADLQKIIGDSLKEFVEF